MIVDILISTPLVTKVCQKLLAIALWERHMLMSHYLLRFKKCSVSIESVNSCIWNSQTKHLRNKTDDSLLR